MAGKVATEERLSLENYAEVFGFQPNSNTKQVLNAHIKIISLTLDSCPYLPHLKLGVAIDLL